MSWRVKRLSIQSITIAIRMKYVFIFVKLILTVLMLAFVQSLLTYLLLTIEHTKNDYIPIVNPLRMFAYFVILAWWFYLIVVVGYVFFVSILISYGLYLADGGTFLSELYFRHILIFCLTGITLSYLHKWLFSSFNKDQSA